MNRQIFVVVAVSVLLGLAFFGIVMGVAVGIVGLNVRFTPGIPWFPLALLVVLVAATGWAQRRWDIGLGVPRDIPLARVYAIAVALTVLGFSIALIQGRFTGMVRATEVLDADVGPGFSFAYAIFMSVFVAVLAEAAFRGVMQSRMQPALGVWPTVAIIAAVNVLAHRWGPEITLNWLGLFVTLAGWTYLRWLAASLWPPLLMHAVTNLLVAVGLWFGGPFEHAALSAATVSVIAIAGFAALALAVALARDLHGRRVRLDEAARRTEAGAILRGHADIMR